MSDKKDLVAPALFAVRAQLPAVVKDAKNPDTNSRYVTLGTLMDTVLPVLAANGLVLVQGVRSDSPESALDVETTLLHGQSGQWMSETVRVPVRGRALRGGGFAPNDPQAGGSALTYGRRYGLSALLGIVADDDDDGAAARSRRQRAATPESQAYADRLNATGAVALDPAIMPVGANWRGKPIADVPEPTLRKALKHCRDGRLTAEAKIVSDELTRRTLAPVAAACRVCGRTDGTHDPEKACYAD